MGKLVLICHQPPHKTAADKAMKLKHVGSRVLRQWMDAHQPLLVLTGHIHESAGWDCYGQTCILNPGSFKEGKYAEAEIDFAAGSEPAGEQSGSGGDHGRSDEPDPVDRAGRARGRAQVKARLLSI